jgi:polyhydroxyalkanoate synthesis regulator phasin
MLAATVADDESLERRVDELEAEVERLREALRALEARLD